MLIKYLLHASIAIMTIYSASANAKLIFNTDKASFNSAVGSATLIDFEGLVPENQIGTYYGGSLTVGDATFTQADDRLYVFNSIPYATNVSDYLNHNGLGSAPVVVTFTTSIFAVGMDIGWLSDFGPGGGTITIDLNNGDSFSRSIVGPLAGTSTPLDFLGFRSDVGFSSITFHDSSNSLMLDNFTYADFPVPIPIPATIWLFSSGLIGLISLAKHKKSHIYTSNT